MIGKIIFQIWALAINVWREASRDRILITLGGFGVLLIFFSLVLGQMAVGGQERVLQNMGFAVIGFWGLLAVLYLGSNLVRQEIKKQTVYLVLSRPVGRVTFLMGKFLGMMLVLLVLFVLLVFSWLLLLWAKNIPITSQHFWALGFILGEWILLASFSLFFASFTSPLLHNFFMFGITFLGHWSNDLRLFALNTKSFWGQKLLQSIYYILPNLEALNFRNEALYGDSIPLNLLFEAAGILGGWMLSALITANLLFLWRKF